MLRTFRIPAMLVGLACLGMHGTSHAEMKTVQAARLHSQIKIDAGAAAIWAYATRGRSLGDWMPMWDRPRNARVNLVRVGDWLQFVDEWNNKGRSVVTYLARNKEVRLANDPEDGTFMCQIKLTLDLDGQGTLVHLYEQYTDESTATDFNATAQKAQASMDRALKSLKTEVERRRGARSRRSRSGV